MYGGLFGKTDHGVILVATHWSNIPTALGKWERKYKVKKWHFQKWAKKVFPGNVFFWWCWFCFIEIFKSTCVHKWRVWVIHNQYILRGQNYLYTWFHLHQLETKLQQLEEKHSAWTKALGINETNADNVEVTPDEKPTTSVNIEKSESDEDSREESDEPKSLLQVCFSVALYNYLRFRNMKVHSD